MNRRQSILEALKNWSKPNPPAAPHRLVVDLNGFVPLDRSLQTPRWTASYINAELFDKIEPKVQSVIAKAATVPAAHPLDERLRPELAAAEAMTRRSAALHPALAEIGKIFASALRSRIEAKAAFENRLLELSAQEPTEGTAALLRELRAQETRSIVRRLVDEKGASAVSSFLKEAMDAERFDIPAAVSESFPVLVDVQPIRLEWARERYPEAVVIERDLDEALADTVKAGSSVLGAARIAVDRATTDGIRDVSAPDWTRPEELETALREAGAFGDEAHGLTMKSVVARS